ncbi:hypothetical protein [Prolixibacter sp. SD074]|jgi:hypothetical protein|uniref:hypothetical protein n=1 Tax=Prolixibacter sp. SD074 TaxID=2652391 RepID=UPI00127F9DFF|nr:hypothetical protein [Prolixibacter sp. SD074]GET29692.1 hypothetical protein SD074_18940 [Prolixibacter sp. SD074]
MQVVFVTAVVFYGIYYLLRTLTDYFLKRRIIKEGHFEKAGILEVVPHAAEDPEPSRHKTLKWALVTFMGGVGLIVADVVQNLPGIPWVHSFNTLIPFGIVLVFVSFGFIIYFIITNKRKI